MRQLHSPNFGKRKDGKTPQFIVLHFTAMECVEEACDWLCDPEREVSAHYILARSGEVMQLVDEENRAWHAGKSYWLGEEDINSASIGIEIDNNGARPFEPQQYQALIALIKVIQARHKIPPQNVLGHMDIAVGRKYDPGPWFDWAQLDRIGVSAPPKAKIRSNDFRQLAASAGYDPSASMADLLRNIRIRHGSTPYEGALRESDFELLA